jgi:salicylate hydroxylase
MRVAIAGAGIGGLTLALALRHHGVDVAVHEQADEVTEIGAGIGLGANSTRLLHGLGLRDAMERVALVPTALTVRRGRDGAVLARPRLDAPYEERFGAPFYVLHRRDMQRVLVEGVGADVIHTGHRAVDVVEDARGARLVLADGASEPADVVVAADGVHSALRRAITGGGHAVFAGCVGYRAMLPVERLPSLTDRAALQFWMGPGRHVVHYPVQGGAVMNVLAVVRAPAWTSDRWVQACDPAEALAAFSGWHPEVTEMVGAMPEGRRWALLERRPLKRWARGRAVLLGDAAHAMLPHQGQGAGQTIEDAVCLAECLVAAGPGGHAEAFARYEAARVRRTRRVAALSRRTGDAAHLPDGPAAEARDAGLATLEDDVDWIHRYDVRGVAAPA